MATTVARDRYGRRLYARHLARRRAWRAARGDADAYREIMQAHLKTGFLYYYEDEPSARRSATAEIWRDCARRAGRWVAFYAILAALILILSALGYLQSQLTLT